MPRLRLDLSVLSALLLLAPAAYAQDACTLPGLQVFTDPAGDTRTMSPQHDLLAGFISEAAPTVSGTDELVFTMQVDNLDPVPALSRWRMSFLGPGGDQFFANMQTDVNSVPRFTYGCVEGTQVQTDGDADFGMFTADGIIQIHVARNNFNTDCAQAPANPAAVPPPAVGDSLTDITAAVQQEVGILLLTIDNATGNTSYTVIGNDACAGSPPVAADDPGNSVMQDSSIVIDVLANDSDPDGDELSITDPGTPTSGTAAVVDNGAGPMIEYTPNAGFTGDDSFTYTISDGSAEAMALVSVTVTPTGGGNTDPVAADDSFSVPADTTTQLDVLDNDSDVDGDTLTISMVSDPANGDAAVAQNMEGDDVVEYTPDTGYTGPDSFTYMISDGNGGTSMASVSLQVQGNTAAMIELISGTAMDFCPSDMTQENGIPEPGERLTLVTTIQSDNNLTGVTGQLVITAGDGTVTDGMVDYPDLVANTPAESVDPHLMVMLSEAAACNSTISYELTISSNEAAPVTLMFSDTVGESAGDGVVYEGVPQAIPNVGTITTTATVFQDDPIVDMDVFVSADHSYVGDLTITLTSPAGTEVILIDGPLAGLCQDDNLRITFDDDAQPVPNVMTQCMGGLGDPWIDGPAQPIGAMADFNGESLMGIWTLTITDSVAPDGGMLLDWMLISDPAIMGGGGGSCTVCARVNTDPVANDDSFNATVNETRQMDVLDNDTDADGDTLTIDTVSDPDNGSTSIAQDGDGTDVVEYTPDTDYSGPDSFTYDISDGNGGTSSATVMVNVQAVNTPPVAADDTFVVNEDESSDLNVLDNDMDVDDDTLSISIDSQPANGTALVANDGSGQIVRYMPNPDYTGPDSFAYTASDGRGGSDSAQVSITVAPANDAPDAMDDAASTAPGTAVTIDVLANDFDPDGDPLSVSAVDDPANGTAEIVNNGDGDRIRYTPDAGFTGAENFSYTASDGNGGTDTARVTVTIDTELIYRDGFESQ